MRELTREYRAIRKTDLQCFVHGITGNYSDSFFNTIRNVLQISFISQGNHDLSHAPPVRADDLFGNTADFPDQSFQTDVPSSGQPGLQRLFGKKSVYRPKNDYARGRPVFRHSAVQNADVQICVFRYAIINQQTTFIKKIIPRLMRRFFEHLTDALIMRVNTGNPDFPMTNVFSA